jgi:phospholipase/carboxylesterase
MTALKQLSGPFLAPRSGKAKQLVMFLHGYGANGADLLAIGEDWAEELPDAAFVSPNAPEVCEAFAAGFQWFSIRAIDEKVFEREKQIEKVTPVLDAFIDAQLKHWGVPESRLIVVGFSQGGMMAMYTMPRRKTACAGIISYSGLLIDAAGLEVPGIVKPPVLAIHGDADEIVPPLHLDAVRRGFTSAGFDVETIMRPGLGHGIDAFGVKRGVEFIKEAFEK